MTNVLVRCQSCGRMLLVNLSGRLPTHNVVKSPLHDRKNRCAGSGSKP